MSPLAALLIVAFFVWMFWEAKHPMEEEKDERPDAPRIPKGEVMLDRKHQKLNTPFSEEEIAE